MRSWWYRTAVVLCLAVMMLPAPVSRAVGAGYKPRQVMALMITKFTRYATWPNADAVQDSATVNVCLVTRDSELRRVFAQTLNDKKIGGKNWKITTVSSLSRADKCPIVFVGRDMPEPDPGWYEERSKRGVLTFGEKEDVLPRTSVVNFVVVDKKVKFDLNLKSALRAGLKLNSRLRGVARDVIDKPDSQK